MYVQASYGDGSGKNLRMWVLACEYMIEEVPIVLYIITVTMV